MKKNLVALAILATSGAAMAQSSARPCTASSTPTSAASKNWARPANQRLGDGGDSGLKNSRWGIRGTEDLGGGLKAYFKLESRFNVDSGTVQDPQFKGETSVGLAGGFGDVKLGYGSTMLDDVRGLSFSSNVFDSAFSPADNGVYKSGGDFTKRATNQLRYETPTFGGFYAGLGYVASDVDAKDLTSVKLGYKAGPLHPQPTRCRTRRASRPSTTRCRPPTTWAWSASRAVTRTARARPPPARTTSTPSA